MANIVGGNSKYLEQKYLEHRNNRDGFSNALMVFSLLGIAILVLGLAFLLYDRSYSILLLGLVVVGVCWVINRLFEKHAKDAGNYRQGQIGEWEVKVELSKLPENYTIFCDLKFANKRWNTDFLVSGPTGIFAIEVKSHSGNIVIANIYDTYFKQAVNSALHIRNYLWQRTGKDIFVKSILVYSDDNAKVKTSLGKSNVTVLHKSTINQFILSQRDISQQHNILEYQNLLTLLTGHNTF